MKKIKFVLPILIVFSVILSGCESSLDNTFSIKNNALEQVQISFRGNLYTVAANSTSTFVIKDIPKGTFAFSTIYRLPADAQTSQAQGDVTGEVTFKQATKVLLVYSSTFIDNSYILFGTLTSSDDLSGDENPVGP